MVDGLSRPAAIIGGCGQPAAGPSNKIDDKSVADALMTRDGWIDDEQMSN